MSKLYGFYKSFGRSSQLDLTTHTHTWDSEYGCERSVQHHFYRQWLHGHVIFCRCGAWRFFPHRFTEK